MRRVVVDGIRTDTVERAVPPTTYSAGARYAEQRAVVAMAWNDAKSVLIGQVRGRARHDYSTVVHFTAAGGTDLTFDRGDCSCPVGLDCKHAVALALTAAAPPRATREVARQADPWERSLGSLLESTVEPEGAHEPIAIELGLTPVAPPRHRLGRAAEPPRATVTLNARLVRPGRTGWVAGGLSWSGLPTVLHQGDFRPEQVRVLQQLYALHASAAPFSASSYGDVKHIDLAAFPSGQLWPLLDEAATAGVQLVHGRKALGPVPPHGRAELCLDVTAGTSPGALVVRPVLRVDGAEPDADDVPVRFLGAQGHGVVIVSRSRADGTPADWPVRLARLTRPVPAPLQRMALDGARLAIPVEDRDRFSGEFAPALRHQATLVSSDEAFTPPEISDPTLVLRASYGAGHVLHLAWEWSYRVGESTLRTSTTPSGTERYRDPSAERAVLDPVTGLLEAAGLRSVLPRHGTDTGSPAAELGGLDTMRFTTETLPLLTELPGVAVEIDGEPADYREESDSLSIGVSTGEIGASGATGNGDVSGTTDWFDLGVSITVDGREVPFTDVFVALASDETHLLLPDGAYFSLQRPELATLRSLIEEARALRDAPDGPLRISRFQAGLWDELTELGVVERQAGAWREAVAGLLSAAARPVPDLPATLDAELRPYQRDGFAWLAFLWESGLGGILADDMGLGKTLQSLALVCHARRHDPAAGPFLIVAPTSVVSNWVTEAARFAPELSVVALTDTLKRRGHDLDELVEGADVVVTSYTLFRLDIEAHTAAAWAGLLLDEAQYVKNHQSKLAECARRLPVPFRLAITGTPMENNLMELWSLLAITAPGLFPSPKRFREHFAQPIERRGDAERLRALRRRIKPLIMRRTKELVAADLPAKQEQILEVELTPRHRTIYGRHLQRERQKILRLVDDVNRNRFTILSSLTLLRQLSLHAGLVDDAHDAVASAKIDALLEQLGDVVDGGHRALVFSQFTGFLGRVRARLDEAGIEYCYLDGATTRRAAVVRRFKQGTAPVFLISLKAGGSGLNLPEADYCFLLDPWWNPATEAQAVDRAHRIGQTRNVMVYRLVATGTIEEKVMALKERKAALFSGVMDEGDVFGSALDADDIRALLD